ncbi:MAG: DNA mismatch repair endonuclease MutL, partial [bacterium]
MPETNKIKILPENLTNKIAAGEVVDRPASVVKELIENSIDAGADNITIIIKDGGKALIQVVDNGYGMHESDLLLAFQRHTTSKIFNYEDLSNIQTLGFRGEALASIASVSLVEAKSVQHDQTSGHLLRMEGGVMQDIEGAGGNPGTSIAVKHLFYNTPARRKFMRKTNTEYRQILNVSNRFFLAYPEITFTLINEGEIIVDLKKASLEQRIKAVLGARIQKNLIPIENEGHIQVSGFTGNQDTMRSSRGDQYLYFNRRYFTNKSLNYAVISAYGDILPRGLNPVYIVFLEMEPEQADVNVHPTKMEIKFANEALIFSTLRGAIKRALTSKSVIPQLSPVEHLEKLQPAEAFPQLDSKQTHLPSQQIQFPTWPNAPSLTENNRVEAEENKIPSGRFAQERVIFERTNIWQVHNKYILSQIKNGLILIDQHVAHERILYEQALDNFEKRNPSSQQLLFPQIVEVSAEDYS